MLKIHIIQAEYGDCLIVELDNPTDRRYLLIDGGPPTIYQAHLRHKLDEIQADGGKLDLAILSHVDDDHIAGILDLMTELQQQQDQGLAETIAISALWHNSFSRTLGQDIETRFRSLMQGASIPYSPSANPETKARSIGQGDELTQSASRLHIPINPGFGPQGLVCIDDAPNTITLGGMYLHVLGPTRKNLDALRKKWLAWLKQQEKQSLSRATISATSAVLKADESVPNLSSIMLLLEATGKTILLTGDGRGDDLLKGLAQAKLLDADGTLHVNVLKLPHHGSQRNVSRKFLTTVTADTYIICANGRDDNPDLNTLKWIVEIAKKQGRTVDILVTNPTDSIRQLKKEYPPDKYPYRLTEMEPHIHALTLDLTLNSTLSRSA